MFKWVHEYSIEVDIPIQKVWEFSTSPGLWHVWNDEYETFHHEGNLKSGSVIKAKVKNANIEIPFNVTTLTPYEECTIFVKVPFFSQEVVCTFKEISTNRTGITFRILIKSWFVLFMKSYLNKTVNNRYSIYFDSLMNSQCVE